MQTIIAPEQAATEYAVRYRLPGDIEETLQFIEEPMDAVDILRDLRVQHGVRGEFVARTVSPWRAA